MTTFPFADVCRSTWHAQVLLAAQAARTLAASEGPEKAAAAREAVADWAQLSDGGLSGGAAGVAAFVGKLQRQQQ